ncbi:MAG: hypothetical protein OXP75_16690 [Rhodospirillales bacterium]|nr:hypothetical protein [Rhodospirillales bacterium]
MPLAISLPGAASMMRSMSAPGTPGRNLFAGAVDAGVERLGALLAVRFSAAMRFVTVKVGQGSAEIAHADPPFIPSAAASCTTVTSSSSSVPAIAQR